MLITLSAVIPAALLSLVGFIDVVAAAGGGRLFGALVFIVGGAVSFGAAGSHWGLRWARPVLTFGGLAVAALAGHHLVILLGEAIALRYFDGSMLRAAVVLGALSAVALVLAWRRKGSRIAHLAGPSTTSELLKEGLGLTAVVGIALTALSFWYTSVYLPTVLPPFLNVTAGTSLAPIASQGDIPIQLQLTISNPGDIRSRVLAGWFNVEALDADQARRAHLDRGPVGARTLDVGKYPDEGSWLDPGEQLNRVLLVYAPSDANAVVIRYDMTFARGDRIDTIPETPQVGTATEGDEGNAPNGTTDWRVRPQSAADVLRRDPLSIRIHWSGSGDGPLSTSAEFRQAGQRWVPWPLPRDMALWSDGNRQTYERYRAALNAHFADSGILVSTSAHVEMPLHQPP